jgi:hypothetical protein
MPKTLRVVLVMLIAVAAPCAMAQTSIGAFTGGDIGEGLDLDGNFVYAVNVGGPAAGPISDANFTTETAPGVTVDAQVTVPDWAVPNYGATTNDDNLETVMESMRHRFSGAARSHAGEPRPGNDVSGSAFVHRVVLSEPRIRRLRGGKLHCPRFLS